MRGSQVSHRAVVPVQYQSCMARTVPQILGLLGAPDAATICVYPLPRATDDAIVERAAAWADVWGADFGRFTAAITVDEKVALLAAGARERQ